MSTTLATTRPIVEFDLANGTLTPGTVRGGNPNQTATSAYNFAHGGTIPVISSNGGDNSTVDPVGDSASAATCRRRWIITLDAYSASDLTNQIVSDIPAGEMELPQRSLSHSHRRQRQSLRLIGRRARRIRCQLGHAGGTGAIRIARSLNFGKVAVNSTKTKTFTIHNAGKGDLHVSLNRAGPFQVLGTGNLNLARDKIRPQSACNSPPPASGTVSQALSISCDDPE